MIGTILEWVGSAVYVAGAAGYARTLLLRWTMAGMVVDHTDETERGFVALTALICGLCWPLVLPCRALRAWLWAPADPYRAVSQAEATDMIGDAVEEVR